MKHIRSWSVLAAMLCISLLIAGCSSSRTVGRVAEKFGETVKNQPATSATAELTADVSVKGAPSNVKFRTVLHGKVDWDARRGYSEAETSFSLPLLELSQNFQCYSSTEKGEALHYIHVDNPEVWLRADSRKSITELNTSALLTLLDSASESAEAELQENTAGGADHYLLKLSFTGKDLEKFLVGSGFQLPQWLKEQSLEGISVPVEVEIEDKTYLPLSILIEIQGIDGALSQALSQELMRDPLLQELDTELEIGDISLLITNFSYEQQQIPKLPMGAAENALDLNKLRELQK